MNKDSFEKKLGEQYVFMNRDKLLQICPESTFARWGVEINSGWYLILERACQRISSALEECSLPQETFLLLQCKQKWGSYRMYWRLDDESYTPIVDGADNGSVYFDNYSSLVKKEIKSIIDEAAQEASHTCEFCGAVDDSVCLCQDSWVYILCQNCQQKRIQMISERKKNRQKPQL